MTAVLLKIYCWIRRWENFENRPAFAKVMNKWSNDVAFYDSQYTCMYIVLNYTRWSIKHLIDRDVYFLLFRFLQCSCVTHYGVSFEKKWPTCLTVWESSVDGCSCTADQTSDDSREPTPFYATFHADVHTGMLTIPRCQNQGQSSLWVACRCGTRCQTTWGIWLSAEKHSGSTWRLFYSHITNACSALQVSR